MAFSNIVINDGATTPVAHTFTPVSENPQNNFHWADRSGGIPVGMPKIHLELKESGPRGTASILTIEVEAPVLETATGSTTGGFAPVPTLAHNPRCVIKMYLPNRSTTQNRKDLRSYVKNLLSDAVLVSAIDDLISPY